MSRSRGCPTNGYSTLLNRETEPTTGLDLGLPWVTPGSDPCFASSGRTNGHATAVGSWAREATLPIASVCLATAENRRNLQVVNPWARLVDLQFWMHYTIYLGKLWKSGIFYWLYHFFCPGLDLQWTIARTKSLGDIWAYFNHLQSPMIPFGIVKYDLLIMGLQLQEERAARRLAYHLTHVGSMAFGIFYDQRCRFMKACHPGPGHRNCWVQCHKPLGGINWIERYKDTNTSRNIYEHHSASNKSSIFSKDLGAMSFPKHHPSRKPVRWHLYVRQLWPHHRWTAPGAMLKLAKTCWANTPIWGYLWISIVTHLVFSCWFMNQFRAYDCLWVCYHAVMNHWRG